MFEIFFKNKTWFYSISYVLDGQNQRKDLDDSEFLFKQIVKSSFLYSSILHQTLDLWVYIYGCVSFINHRARTFSKNVIMKLFLANWLAQSGQTDHVCRKPKWVFLQQGLNMWLTCKWGDGHRGLLKTTFQVYEGASRGGQDQSNWWGVSAFLPTEKSWRPRPR